ncbi:hypothetical protein [Pseudonocardia zijingensis]|jgi:hypothetical protein|uniref:SRPBCC family protein n=1 Tax=Pseudonocardia zijingensis TaxID=153376 RepID=A0ABN1P442_9PSEU
MSEVGDRAPTRPVDMLIDRFLPRFDVMLIEHTVADADVATTWKALRELDLMQVHTPLMDAAVFVRGLPARVAARFGRAGPPELPRHLLLTGDGPEVEGWLSLGESAEREIAQGAVGRFWQPDIEWYDVSGMTPQQFAAFDEPGWGRIAASFSVRPYGTTRTLISYEARTATGDAAAARRFRLYWVLVRPFVRHIMRAALTSLRRSAESRAS